MAENKEYVATITSKGQVTIPLEIRKRLGLAARDNVIFRLGKGNRVEMEPLPMSLEEAYGSVTPLHRPGNVEELRRTADEEREDRWLSKAHQ